MRLWHRHEWHVKQVMQTIKSFDGMIIGALILDYCAGCPKQKMRLTQYASDKEMQLWP